MEDLMYRFGECLMYGLPFLCVLAGACSSDDSATPGGDAGVGFEAGIGVDAGTDADAGFPADASDSDAATTTATVTIPSGAAGQGLGAYSPNPVVVSAGTTVMWMNADSVAHTATSTTSVWDSGSIPPGGTFSRAFPERGTFPYFCTIHGATSMSGSVVVE
jgi:plastocyanin